MRYIYLLLALILFSLPARTQEIAAPNEATLPADLVIWGGDIYTAVETKPQVEALAIRNGIIIKTGTTADINSVMGPDTQILDLKGNTAFPGFIDAHAHLAAIGNKVLSLDLSSSSSLDSLKKALLSWHVSHPDEATILGQGWIETHWPEARFPTRWDLDAIINDRPVILSRADGHALVANSKAIAAAGITQATKAPFGGAIQRNALGEMTGIFIDAAQSLFSSLIPPETPEMTTKNLQAGATYMEQQGWTSVHSLSTTWAETDLLDALSDSGEIGLRVYNSLDQKDSDKLISYGAKVSSNGKIITRAIKLYIDGALGSRGAALFEPYSDAQNTSGLLMTTKERTLPILAAAITHNIQVSAHAIGDRANNLILNWYEEAFKQAGIEEPLAQNNLRWRIEHAQIIQPSDIPRFAALGVIASMQPSHAIDDLFFAPARLGLERLKGAYAWNSLIKSGAIIAGGSDAPVEVGNPVIEFYAAISRKDLSGYQGPGWHPEEAVSRSDALKMFTLWPAIASFQENRIGSIEEGKEADISVFNVNLMTADEADILKAKTVLSLVKGQIIHKAPPPQDPQSTMQQ